MARTAKVYLVGARPGDPDLLTRKALRLPEEADIVLYDRLISAAIPALDSPNAGFINEGKEYGPQQQTQSIVFEQFLYYASRSGVIARLKSGDPVVFGRGGEDPAPRISSALAASFSVIAGRRQSQTTLDRSSYQRVDTLVNAPAAHEHTIKSTFATVAVRERVAA